MSSVDNRIVNMVFNNKGFEAGVASTLASLKKLNESLKMKNTGKGLDEVGKGINNLSKSGLGSLGSSVDGVSSKFSAMGVIAASALATITNKAVNAGTALIKSLTIDPIKSGLDEYETKMNSIQTIFANTSHKGTTYDDITKALEELNKYSDKTIYNFGQMTDNIGKFTAAGVDLDTSVSAIKGLANLAAMSGVDNARAQGVMYQASQALSKGFFALQDWRSFSNNGMGNDRFKQLLIETGDLLGMGASAAIEAAGSFDESLTKSKWLTNDVMNESLKMLAGYYDEADLLQMGFNKKQAANILDLADQAEKSATQIRTVTQLFDTMKETVGSGWAKTWEMIIGDKEQATKLLTSINDAFGNIMNPIAEARNKMFEEWNKGGGRDAAIQGFANIFGSIGKVAGSVGSAFRDIFPAMTGKRLIELTKGFENFTKKLKVSDETAAKIKDTFKGVFSVFDFAKNAVTSVIKAFAPAGGMFGGLTNGLLTVTSTIGKFFTAINNGVKSSGIFDKISSSISNGIKGIGDGFNKAGEFVGNLMKSLGKMDFKPLFDFFGQTFSGFGKGISDVFSGIGKAIGNINLNTILGGLAALAGKGMFDKLGNIFENIAKSTKSLSGIGDNIKEVLSGVTDSLKAMASDVNAGALLKVAGAVGILALSLSALSTIDGAQLETALTGLAGTMALLIGAFAALSKISGGGTKGGFLGNLLGGLFGTGQLVSVASSLLIFSAAVLVLSGAVKTLSKLNPQQMITGLAGIAGSLLALVGAAKLLDGVKGHLVKAGASMILMATALNIMASAVQKFGQINPNNMVVGLMGIASVLLELVAFMKLADFSGMGMSSAAGIAILAASLLILQNAVSKFGSMDVSGLTQGLAGIAGVLAVIAGFSHISGSATHLLGVAAALVVMGGALHVLSSALHSMAGIKCEDIGKGLVAIAGSLLIFAAAVRIMSGLKLAAVGAGLIIASAGLLVMASALKSLGEMSWDEMARGLVALAGGLLVLGVAAAAMSGTLVGAGAMLVLAAAMAILTPQLVALSNLSWGQIAAGLAMLAGSLLILGVAGIAATAIGPGLLMLGGAVALLGAGCLAAGAGLTLFAGGLATLAAVGAAGGLALVEVLRQLIDLLPQLGTKFGEFLVNMAAAIGQGIPTLVAAFGQLITGILQAFVTYGPQIIQLGTQLITMLCNALIQSGPILIQTAVNLVLMLINGLAGAAGQLVTAGANLIVNLINGLTSKVGEIIQATINLGIAVIDGLAQGIEQNAAKVGAALGRLIKAAASSAKTVFTSALKELGVSGVTNLVSGITGGVGKAVAAMASLVGKVASTAKQKATQFLAAGKQWVTSIASGVRGAVGTVIGAISSLVSNAVNRARSAASQFLSAARQWVSQLASGIRSGAGQAAGAVRSCVSSAVSAARSAAGQFISAGRSMIQGLISGIKSAAASVASAAKSVVQGAINAAKSALKINSPSKVFIEIGKFTGEGMVVGMNKTARAVALSAEDMAKGAIDNVRNSVSKIAEAVNTNIDAQPTIRPVLDLANIESGANSINNMLSNSAISADLSSSMSRNVGRIQNGNNNSELLSAIKDLQGNVGKSGDTYQINGITYDDGSAISSAVQTLIRAAKIERRM